MSKYLDGKLSIASPPPSFILRKIELYMIRHETFLTKKKNPSINPCKLLAILRHTSIYCNKRREIAKITVATNMIVLNYY